MSEPVKDKKLQWAMYFVLPLITLLSGGQAWQFLKTPDKIIEVTHHPDQLKEDSLRTKKISEEVMDKLMDKKLAGLLLSRGISEQFHLTEDETKKLEGVVREVLDSNDVWNNNRMISRNNRKALDKMCGYIYKEGSELFFKDCQNKVRRIKFGRGNTRWTQDAYYYRDDNDNAIRLSNLSEMVYNQ